MKSITDILLNQRRLIAYISAKILIISEAKIKQEVMFIPKRRCNLMLYSLYIPKHFRETSRLPHIIGDFLSSQNKQFDITISPGFLGTNCESMTEIFNATYVRKLTLYSGMTQLSCLCDNRNKFDTVLNSAGNHRNIHVTAHNTKKDHRKMIFFNYLSDTTGYNVEAILIGSSNFSDNTYFQKNKGEADLLLFYDTSFCEQCRRHITHEEVYYRDCVLSESIAINGTAIDYLNNIFIEFIMNA